MRTPARWSTVQAKPREPIKVTKVVAYHTRVECLLASWLIAAANPRQGDRAWCRAGVRCAAAVAGCLLGAVRRRGAWPAGAAAGDSLESVPARSGHGARRTVGVPAKGVTGTGYSGHYFGTPRSSSFRSSPTPRRRWHAANCVSDTTCLVLPPSRGGTGPKWRTLPLAYGQRRGGIGLLRGRHRAISHRRRYCVCALCKYVAASGDQDFMNREGVDLLVETARLWADLGFWRENGSGLRSFHIHG